jgi:hypothetical protein
MKAKNAVVGARVAMKGDSIWTTTGLVGKDEAGTIVEICNDYAIVDFDNRFIQELWACPDDGYVTESHWAVGIADLRKE